MFNSETKKKLMSPSPTDMTYFPLNNYFRSYAEERREGKKRELLNGPGQEWVKKVG